MTDDRLEPRGSYRNSHPERRLRMENPYGGRERRDQFGSRNRGGFRHAEERETDRHAGRYRDDGYRGGSRRAHDGLHDSHDQRGYGQYPPHAGYDRKGYDDRYDEKHGYGYGMRNEAPQRFDEGERDLHRQNDGGRQHHRSGHQDYYGRNAQQYRGSSGNHDSNRYDEGRGRYDTRHSKSDYEYHPRGERNAAWSRGGGGNIDQGHGWDQRYGDRHDRHGGGYPPRGTGRRDSRHEEAYDGRYGRRSDMGNDRYARNSKPYSDKGYGYGDRSTQGQGTKEAWDESSAAGALSPADHSDSDPMLKGEYMFGYAQLPPQIWEDIPTDHGTSESDEGEVTSDRPTSGVRRKIDELDLEDRPEPAKRARGEKDAPHFEN